MTLRRSSLLRAVALSLPLCLSLWGQNAELTGMISDRSGGVITNASVTVTNEDTGVALPTTSNLSGYYTVGALIPGNYKISVTAAGFRTFVRSAITLEVAQVARVDVELDVGQTTETISVVSTAPLLQSETVTIGQLVNQQTVVDLPLNGRQFTQLALLTPGSAAGGSTVSGGTIVQFNGGRTSQTSFVVDGVYVTDQHLNGTLITPPPDAIAEFRVQTNSLSAEYGQEPATISVALKSGTNQFHGSLYEFLRNDATDARNFFAQGIGELRQNQFGGTFGGPILHNKTFFFVDYQGTRIRRGTTTNSIVPTAAERSGDFSGQKAVLDPLTGQPFPNNVIPASRQSPQATFFLPFFPTANFGARNFIFTPSAPTTVDQFDAKVDHHFSDRDILSYSQTFQLSNQYQPGPFPQNGGVTTDIKPQRFGLAETHIFGPATLNEFSYGYMRYLQTSSQQGLGVDYIGQAGIGGLQQTSAEFPGFPGLSPTGFAALSTSGFQPAKRGINSFLASDKVALTRRSHTIKMGVDIRTFSAAIWNGGTSRGNFTFNGTYTGNAWADYLVGIPFQGQRTFPRDEYGATYREQQFFVQDDWKVSSRLTLNLGLRYDLDHPAHFLHNQAASVDPVLNKIIVASSDDGKITPNAQQITPTLLQVYGSAIVPSSQVGLSSTLRQSDLNNFAPRVGLAWRSPGDFVLRAGYGLFYILEEGNQTGSTALINPPFLQDEVATFNLAAAPYRTLATFFQPISPQGIGLAPPVFYQLNPNRPIAYLQQWNFTLQKAWKGFVFESAYVGSEGVKVPFSIPVNVPLPGPGAIQSRRANPSFSSGSRIENISTSSYNALQSKAEVRSWHGLTMMANYTFGKGLGLLSSNGEPETSTVQDFTNARVERGRGPLDIQQSFIASVIYRLPSKGWGSPLTRSVLGGWGISNIITRQTGFPFTPSIGTDPANTGTSKRPDRLQSGVLSNPSISRWFNTAAFSVPQLYTFGNSGNNILTGPALMNWDFALLRAFPFEAMRVPMGLEFRAEFFNLANHPNFGLPVTNIQAATAGQILSAGTPRDIQFGLKFSF
jgi:hypothetical protein